MPESNCYFDFDNTIKVLTLIIGVLGLGKALVEYTKAQRWKKAEFLAKEVKDFYADKNVQRALLMLDWSIIDIPLFEIEQKQDGIKTFLFKDDMFIQALKHHTETLFTDEETVIRQTVDEFLVKLSMFQSYIDSKLAKPKDLEPYFSYWIKLIGDKEVERKSQEFFNQLWKFINYYDYNQIIKLFKSFGYDILTGKKPRS